MKSMTGFGKQEVSESGFNVTVEIKSVNNRFLDANIKLPKMLNFLDDAIRKQLQKSFVRGRVDVFVTLSITDDKSKQVTVDHGVAASLVNAAERLSAQFAIENDLTTSRLLKMPEVVSIEPSEQDEEKLSELVLKAVAGACEKSDNMRTHEGEQLKKDIAARMETVSACSMELKKLSPVVVETFREKLKQRVSEALGEVEIDEARLLSEVAFFADKCNIDEEITRLNAHITQMNKLIQSRDAIGRNLDFMVQELNREANTVCSKANNSDVTKIGVDLKCEIEKIREQVQNIE